MQGARGTPRSAYKLSNIMTPQHRTKPKTAAAAAATSARTNLRVISWNVNGLRACANKGFAAWLDACGADIVGLQEVRATAQQLPAEIRAPQGWHPHIVSGQRPGYSGVGLYSRRAPDHVETSMGKREFDAEGRMQLARFGRLIVANVYFPNGKGKELDNGRVPYKLAFYRRLYEMLAPDVRKGAPMLVMGDFNTAHKPIDLARPKENEETSGFLPEERAELDRWLAGGWVDTFRHFEPGPGHYSWWSQRGGARERNVGWRIDYVLASSGAMPFVKAAFIHPNVKGSDHCPVGVEMNSSVCG